MDGTNVEIECLITCTAETEIFWEIAEWVSLESSKMKKTGYEQW